MELTQGQISEIISNYLPLWYQQQLTISNSSPSSCCDLLENIYLCGINNNTNDRLIVLQPVVICLKISTFVVSTTTAFTKENGIHGL